MDLIVHQYFLYLNDISPLSLHNQKELSFTSLNTGKYKYCKLLSINSFNLVIKVPYLRESFVSSGVSVTSILSRTFSNTIVLASSSIIFAIIFGLLFGVISALNSTSIIDKIILIISSFGMSLPSFFSSIIIAWLFGFVLHEYTGLQMNGSLFEVDDFGRGLTLKLKNLMLPAFALGIRPLAVITQLSRNSLLDVFTMDYIRTAKAKGLPRILIIFKHALRNSLNPVITAISGWFASLLAGSVFVEYIFGWNGIGKEIVDSLTKLDMPVIMGAVLLISFLFVLINLLVDLIYAWLDPRIKLF